MCRSEDVQEAISLGVDAVGFIFAKKSVRYISPDRVVEIVSKIPPFVSTVGVFVDADISDMNQIADQCGLDYLQLHGVESPELCQQLSRPVIKAIRVSEMQDLDGILAYESHVSAILLDTKVSGQEGGTGKVFDWKLACLAQEKCSVPIILAGGISDKNIESAVQMVNPYGIDLSSGIEGVPREKSVDKMRSVMRLFSMNRMQNVLNGGGENVE